MNSPLCTCGHKQKDHDYPNEKIGECSIMEEDENSLQCDCKKFTPQSPQKEGCKDSPSGKHKDRLVHSQEDKVQVFNPDSSEDKYRSEKSIDFLLDKVRNRKIAFTEKNDIDVLRRDLEAISKQTELRCLSEFQQMLIDAPQLCKNCFSNHMQCEGNILRFKERCCKDCWHQYIDMIPLEEKITARITALKEDKT